MQDTPPHKKSTPTLAKTRAFRSAAGIEDTHECIVGSSEEKLVQRRVRHRVEGGDASVINASLLVASLRIPYAQRTVPRTRHHLARIVLPHNAGHCLFVPVKRTQRDLQKKKVKM